MPKSCIGARSSGSRRSSGTTSPATPTTRRPWTGAAEVLATRTDWSPLYDVERLAANEVPVAAVVYYDDVYVDSGLSLETTAAVGNLRAWVTNEYEPDGLRLGNVFSRLRTMVEEVGGVRRDGRQPAPGFS